MEVACEVDDLDNVVIRVLFISTCFNAFQQIKEVLVSDGELFKQAVLLEEFKPEVSHRILLKDLTISMCFEIPFVEVVHHFKDVCPDSGIDVKDLFDALLLFFNLKLVQFLRLSMELFQEIIKVTFKP